MTKAETLTERIAAQIQAWRDIGQGGHADALRARMWQILGPFMAKPSGH